MKRSVCSLKWQWKKLETYSARKEQKQELERENRYHQVEQCLLQMEASEMQEEIDEYRKQLTQYEEEMRELRDYIQELSTK